MSRSMTKAQTALIHAEQNRMIPRLSFMRPEDWRSFVSDLDTIGAIPSKESGAAEPPGHRDQRTAVSGTRPARDTPGYKARPVHHPGPTDRRLRPTGAPVGGAATSASPGTHQAPTRQRPGSRDGYVHFARVHRTPTCRRPRSGVEHRSRLVPPGSPPCPHLRSHDAQTS